VTVALTANTPQARGRTWTAEDYAKRDAAMAALGFRFGKQRHKGR
jgi:hypothetical protein